MFDTLSDRLGSVFDRLRGRGALSEADVRAAMREVRVALLEADVALPVARDFVDRVTEKAVGQAAPWFIFGVMLFSYAVRAIYVESCAMFTRGGVYRVVKEAMGGTLAKLSVSALMFDYILTGPISGVSAGQYIVSLTAQTATYFGHPWEPTKETINLLAAGLAVLVTMYFWWRNTKGIHESSDDALRIMYTMVTHRAERSQ